MQLEGLSVAKTLQVVVYNTLRENLKSLENNHLVNHIIFSLDWKEKRYDCRIHVTK